jgi:Fe-S-cluster containining protein
MEKPTYSDSIQKIKSYFFELDKDILHFSPLFLRTLKCNKFCGGCCPKFSLDYIKDSQRWRNFVEQYPEKVQFFEERKCDNAVYMSYTQVDNTGYYCNFLDKQNGLCTIHTSNPFHCEFEIIKLRGQNEFDIPNDRLVQVSKKPFSEADTFKCVDGTIGAKCEIEGFNKSTFLRDIEMLKELQEHYVHHFLQKNIKLETLIQHLEANYDLMSGDIFIIGDRVVSKEEVLRKVKL